ncbi:hypothetical protein JDV02_009147 [Purpureocillium takamizusanense]|uniref:Uncharacterized protein n=1 Tax=Purpureocillium takamizusanense TaxID=2060973 RepID=A0A9Q8QRT8_9HYPO|nr:uncharacterized protein JDV02_009147 [Purpureocillium takamizusanense]UNI23317.1 hypothetical protein JDV02_009147 [Purpureocillium takamizusanense]
MRRALFALLAAYSAATANAGLTLIRGRCYADGCMVALPVTGKADIKPCRSDYPCQHFGVDECAFIQGQDMSMCNAEGIRLLQEKLNFLEAPVPCQERGEVRDVSPRPTDRVRSPSPHVKVEDQHVKIEDQFRHIKIEDTS